MDDSQLRIMIEAQNRASKTLQEVQRDVQKMSESAEKDFSKIKNSASSGILDGFKGAIKTAGSAVVDFVKKLGSIAWSQIKAGAVAASAALIGLGTKGLTSASQLQALQISMNGLTGSMEAGSKAMAVAYEYAQQAPFQLPDVAQTTKSLIAMGVEVDKTGKMLETIGGIAITSGGQITDIGRIYGQVFATGKLQLEDMNQLTDNGVGIQKQLEKQLGVTGAEVRQMATDGKISFAEFEKAMESMVDPKILEQLNNTLPRQLDRLKGSIRQISNAFVGVSVDATNGLKMAENSVAQAATTFMKTLADALRTDELKEEIGSLGLTFVPIIQSAQNAITPLIGILTSIAYPISTILGMLVTVASNLITSVAPGFQVFMDTLDNGFNAIAPVVGQVATTLGGALSQALTALAPAVAPLAEAFNILAPVLGDIIGQVAILAAQFVAGLAPILPPLAQAFAQIAQAIMPIIPPLVNLATQILPPLVLILTDIIVALVSSLQPYIPMIVQSVVMLAQAFMAIITALAPVLPMLVQLAVEIIMQILVPLLPTVVQLVQLLASVFVMVMQALEPVLPQLMELTMTLVQALAPILPTVAQLFIQLIQALMPILPPILELAMILLPPLISGLQIVIQVITIMSSIFTSVVVGAVSAVIQIFRVIVQWVANVGNIFNAVVGVITGAVTAIYNTVSTGLGNVVDFFVKLPGRIIGGLGDIGGMLVDVGKNMIDGLIKGISGAKDAVVNKIKEIASEALDAIKDFFGIHSPSRVMANMGQFMMQGLNNGLESMRKTVVSTATDIAGEIDDGFNPDKPYPNGGGLTGAGARAATGGSVNYGGNTTRTTNEFNGQIVISTPQAADAFFNRLDRDGELASLGVPT